MGVARAHASGLEGVGTACSNQPGVADEQIQPNNMSLREGPRELAGNHDERNAPL